MTGTSAILTGTFADRYALQGVLGRGGTAVVYLARDTQRDRPVAIKVLRPELAESMAEDRFLREIRTTAQLQHPHIVHVLDSGKHENHLFFVLPLMEGGTLRDRLERETQLPLDETIAIAKSIAAALTYAEEQGLIHRDVKPENILFTSGEACLSDFGIARAMERAIDDPTTTTTGIIRGTPPYMSPEQLTGSPTDGRSDVYSLACVVYEMLAGILPYTGPTRESVAAQKILHPPTSLRIYRPMMSEAVDRVLTRALAMTPADRFRTAAEFADALDSAARMPADSRAVGSSRRRIWWVAGVAAVGLAVAGIAAWRFNAARGASLDPNRVMVFPLSTSGVPQQSPLGEDAATVIGSALDGAGPLHAIDAWRLLPSSLRDPTRGIPAETAAGIARAHQSGRYLTGRIQVAGDSAFVFLELWNTNSDQAVERVRTTGKLRDASLLSLRALNGILPQLVGGGAARDAIAGWEDRDPASIASFLLGESAYRRAQVTEALARYDDAVRRDSLFSYAAIRGAQAAMANHLPEQSAMFVRAASRRPLSPRYDHLVRGFKAYLDGRADSAVAQLRAALREDPRLAVAWAQIGEVYTHLLPSGGSPDSLAADAFSHAIAIDSLAANFLYHPIQIALRRGDLARAEPMLERFMAARPETTVARSTEIMTACVRQGAANVRWDDLARTRPLPLLNAAVFLAAGGARLSCSVSAFRQLLSADTSRTDDADGRRWVSLIGLSGALMAQGRSGEAAEAIETFNVRWGYGASLFLFAGPLDTVMAPKARAVAAADSARYGGTYDRMPFIFRLWEVGQWKLHEGNIGVATAIARTLQSRADSSKKPLDRLLAHSLHARIAAARADTVNAVAFLQRIVPTQDLPSTETQWHEEAPATGERLLLSKLLAAKGDHIGSLRMLEVVDSPAALIHLYFLRASLMSRLEAAAALGDPIEKTLRQRVAALGR